MPKIGQMGVTRLLGGIWVGGIWGYSGSPGYPADAPAVFPSRTNGRRGSCISITIAHSESVWHATAARLQHFGLPWSMHFNCATPEKKYRAECLHPKKWCP